MRSSLIENGRTGKVFLRGGGHVECRGSDLRLWQVAVEVEYGAEGEPAGF
jgi:hypothetical protein